LTAALAEWNSQPGQTILSFHGERSRRKFLQMIEPEGLAIRTGYAPNVDGVFALISPLRHGMELAWRNTRILAEDILHPDGGRAGGGERADKEFKGLSSFDEIRPGDLVVHKDYGVGSFEGLTRMTVDATGGDYLLLHFADDDKLYLPADRLGMLQRYKGPEGLTPPLDRLGGTRWKSVRERAKKAIERIAADLVEMYAYRQVAKGYAYGPTNELYLNSRPRSFRGTPDQAGHCRCPADMDRSEPMDRLVCGDVGFGKTEVALRPRFGRARRQQVAMLCRTHGAGRAALPPRIRLPAGGFPVRVECCPGSSRPSAQGRLEAVARARSTSWSHPHRILSSDVTIPTSACSPHEEQRFGVKHKERLKPSRKISSPSLTDTPIPRTQQLSLSGAGTSVIETPPADARPWKRPWSSAIRLFNERCLAGNSTARGSLLGPQPGPAGRSGPLRARTLPEPKVAMAHAQMSETALEGITASARRTASWLYVHHRIRPGFPRANTLVVTTPTCSAWAALHCSAGRALAAASLCLFRGAEPRKDAGAGAQTAARHP
jgi:transcription-repair coupling factor (superfamily II helicase)